jgi:hypothetical protein
MASRKQAARPGGLAAASGTVVGIGIGLSAVALTLLAKQGHAEVMPGGFIMEDLDSMREFFRHPSLGGLKSGLLEAWAIIGPGGRLHPGWFLEHKGHLVIEGLLIVIIAVMLLQSRFSPKATEEDDGLTDQVRTRRVACACPLLLLLLRLCVRGTAYQAAGDNSSSTI